MDYFDSTITIETNEAEIKNKMEDLFSKQSLKQRKRGVALKKKILFTYILKSGLQNFSEAGFEDFITTNIRA